MEKDSKSGAWKTLPYVQKLAQGIDPRSILIGENLFHLKTLSRDRDQSCATCHSPKLHFADKRTRSKSKTNTPLKRHTPTLINVVFQKNFFWDGRATSLEDQLQGPLFSPEELGLNKNLLLERLAESPLIYESLLKTHPPKPSESHVDWALRAVTAALVDYQSTILSFSTPYDRYILGDHNAFSESEFRGFNVFRSFVSRCAECHIPPLFTSREIVVIGVPDRVTYHNKGQIDDYGTMDLSQNPLHKGAFKIPTLRNISMTGPYMHNGRFESIQEILEFYNDGGGRNRLNEIPKGLHWHIRPMGLTNQELSDLEVFLKTL